MEHDLQEAGGVIRCSFSRGPVPCQTSHEARVTLQLNLPAQPCHELLEGLRPVGVGQDADLVLLALRHVDDGNLVSLPTFLRVKISQFPHQLLALVDEMNVWAFLPRRESQLLEEDPGQLEGLVVVTVLYFWRVGWPGLAPVRLVTLPGQMVLVHVPLTDDGGDDVALHLLVDTSPVGQGVERVAGGGEQLRRGVTQVLEEVVKLVQVQGGCLVARELAGRSVPDGVTGRRESTADGGSC